MPFSRRGVFVRMVILASCIAAAGEVAAQPKTPIPDVQAQQTAKKAAGELFADRFTQAKTTAAEDRLQGLSPEEVLRRFTPREVLGRFTPEELAGGLSDEQAERLRELLERKKGK